MTCWENRLDGDVTSSWSPDSPGQHQPGELSWRVSDISMAVGACPIPG